jgi:glycosyltransferase involved in cell wall biosynthesis
LRLCFISNPNTAHTRRWVSWFAEHGHQVCLIADNKLQEPWPGLQVYDLAARVSIPVLKYLIWEVWTRQIIRRWQPDILHAHRVSSAGWLGAFAGFDPFVVTPWGSDLYQHPNRSWMARRLAFYVLRRANMVTADSEDLRQQAIRFGADPGQAHIVQWGVDLELFNLEGDTTRLREWLGIGDAPVVLSPRGVTPLYNLDVIVAAIPRVRAVIPDTIFVLRDYNTEPACKASLEALIARLGVQEGVRWLGRLDRWEETADTYRLADVVASVPSSDGTPVSVLESMACGVPPVVSDLPSLREWITDGENGLLVPVGDVEALAEAIVYLLQNPQKRAEFRQQNLSLIQERANHQAEMAKMEALYYTLLESVSTQ